MCGFPWAFQECHPLVDRRPRTSFVFTCTSCQVDQAPPEVLYLGFYITAIVLPLWLLRQAPCTGHPTNTQNGKRMQLLFNWHTYLYTHFLFDFAFSF